MQLIKLVAFFLNYFTKHDKNQFLSYYLVVTCNHQNKLLWLTTEHLTTQQKNRTLTKSAKIARNVEVIEKFCCGIIQTPRPRLTNVKVAILTLKYNIMERILLIEQFNDVNDNIKEVQNQLKSKPGSYYTEFGNMSQWIHIIEIRTKALAYWKRKFNRILEQLKYQS